MQRTHKFRTNKLNKEKHWQKGDFGRRIHATKSNQFVISSCTNPLKAPDIFDSDLKLLHSECVCVKFAEGKWERAEMKNTTKLLKDIPTSLQLIAKKLIQPNKNAPPIHIMIEL